MTRIEGAYWRSLGFRAVALACWRWCEGMAIGMMADRIYEVTESGRVRTHEDPLMANGLNRARRPRRRGPLADLPDLTDPATLGCVAHHFASVYGYGVSAACTIGEWHSRGFWRIEDLTGAPMSDDYPSAAEAWIALMEGHERERRRQRGRKSAAVKAHTRKPGSVGMEA